MSQSVYPAIAYQDAAAAVDFLERAFGFEQREMHRDENGKLAHGELALGGAIVMLGDESAGGLDLKSGRTLGGSAVCVYIAIEDPDALAERARDAGAEMVRDLNDTDYGSREFTCRDPEGVIWSFGTYRPS